MQTVLVTGANGFVGYYLIQQLLQKDWRVIATGKGGCRLPFLSNSFLYEPLDFTDAENVKTVFEKHRPDAVVHSGAMSKPDECEANPEKAYATNVTGTVALLREAAIYKSFFIFLSTDFIFSGDTGMYSENDEPAPVNYYGQTKVWAEAAVKQYAFAWSIVRTVLVYGKVQQNRQNIVTNVAAALQRGDVLHIYDDQVRTPTYVEDLASAIIAIMEKQKTGVYHISGADVLTPYGIALAVAAHLQLNQSLIRRETADTFHQPARRPLKTGFNIAKAQQELHYLPTSFQEGLRKTLE